MNRELVSVARHVRRNLPRDAWADVEDPRDPRGRRHDLTGLLQLLMVGLATAMPTLRDVEALARRLACRRTLGIRACPSDTTLYRLLRALLLEDVLAVLYEQVRRMHRNGQLEVLPEVGISLVAIDGKALGTDKGRLHPEAQGQGKGGTSPFVLRALRAVHVGSAVKPVMDQMVVPANKGESSALVPFVWRLLQTYGRSLVQCITLDAGFCYLRDLMTFDMYGILYIVAVKENWPSLLRAAKLALGTGDDPPPEGWGWQQTETAGGRRVTRWFAGVPDTSGVAYGCVRQLWRLRQKVERAGEVTWEDRYFATNLPVGTLSDAQYAHAIRLHWGIENDSNWTMDAVWKEDCRAWARRGRSMEVLAVLRCMAVNLVRLLRCRALRSLQRRGTPYRQLLFELRLSLCTMGPAWSGFT